MLRNTRSLLTSSPRAIVSQKPPTSSLPKPQLRARTTITRSSPVTPRALGSRSALTIQKAQYATKAPSGIQYGKDPEAEKKAGQQKLESNPEVVTTESSVRHVYEPDSPGTQKPIRHGIKDDLETVKETFDLSTVPKEPYILGLAGTLPYLATSISTVYLSWNLNVEWPTTSNFLNNILMSHDTAHHLLSVIEPIQLGYGAIIISFLGAVHWGMEYAEKVPDAARTRFRYGLGVLASVVAWPTLFMPVDFALTAQFAAFMGLYFADSRATVRAWAPSWYGSYRFVLTAVVGAAIFISLIGRMKVGDAKPRLTGLDEKMHDRSGGEQDYTKKWQDLEKEEKEKIEKEKEEAENKKKEEEKNAKQAEKKGKGDKKKDKGTEGAKQGDENKGDQKKDSDDVSDKEKDTEEQDNEEESGDEKNDEKGGDKDGEKSEGKSDEKSDEKDEGNDKKGSKEKGDKDKSDEK